MVIASLLLTLPSAAGIAGEKLVIRHKGFEDFSKGSFGDGGTNIYVSRRGSIQIIPRWDINQDGHLDLLFNQDHNPLENVDAFIHWGTEEGYHSLFPPFWKQLPAFKLVRAMDRARKHISFLPTFGSGPVKLVDLNRDGHLDIIFPNTIHNYFVEMQAYIYWGGPAGYSPRRRTELPTLFAEDLAVADFNRDGYLDLVFANFGNESGDRFGYKNHLASYLYWGAPDGFSVERRTAVPSVSAVSCAAGDFNDDQWPDLVIANNNKRHKSVYVYLGGREGLSPNRRLDLEGGDPGLVRACDLNQNGKAELIVSRRGTGSALYYGSSSFRLDHPVSLPTQHARDAALSDLNRDGHMDLVFATGMAEISEKGPGEEAAAESIVQTRSEIYWGSEAGFDGRRRLLLPTLSPRAVAAADLNGDGYPEIIFANEHDGQTHDVPSYIYWGGAGGFDASRRTQLQGFGPVGVAAADLDGNGLPEVVLMNQLSGSRGPIPSVVFWGNRAHHYSEANATLLPADHPYFSKIADLDDDGYPDIVFGGNKAIIHWGSAQGLRRQSVVDARSFSVVVADFNRDGFLDLGFATTFFHEEQDKTHGRIVWGSSEGFSTNTSTTIPLKAVGTHGVATADLNRDGYLDLVFCAGETPTKLTEIVWGGPDGFGRVPSTLLETNGVQHPAFADLDKNGWVDVIFPGSQNLDTQDPHTKTLIYWGSAGGFSDDRRTELEAYGSHEIGVADLNRDGHLDFVSSNYKAAHTRSLPIFVYWGGAANKYSNQNRTELPAESSCGVQILDLNGDEYPEIIVHNHIKDGDHSFGAYIYWGGPRGYSVDRRDHLPTMGTHYALGITPGNLYDRSPGHDYISPPVPVPPDAGQVTLDWTGQTPHNTAIRFEIRTGGDEAQCAEVAWSAITPGKPLMLPSGHGVLQYRAVLVSPDGGSSPLLREVILRLE